MNNNNNNLLSYMKWELKLVPFFLYSANFPQNCPSNDAFNSESPITELVMMASPRCRDGFDRRYYIETLRDHRNNCEFDIIATIKHFHNQWCHQGGACGFICTQSMHLCTHPMHDCVVYL